MYDKIRDVRIFGLNNFHENSLQLFLFTNEKHYVLPSLLLLFVVLLKFR